MPREFIRTDKNPYRGVSLHSRDGKHAFKYRMKITSASRHLTWPTLFEDPQAAARVFNQAAILLRGPDADAILNFPDDRPREAHPAFPCPLVYQWLIERGALQPNV